MQEQEQEQKQNYWAFLALLDSETCRLRRDPLVKDAINKASWLEGALNAAQKHFAEKTAVSLQQFLDYKPSPQAYSLREVFLLRRGWFASTSAKNLQEFLKAYPEEKIVEPYTDLASYRFLKLAVFVFEEAKRIHLDSQGTSEKPLHLLQALFLATGKFSERFPLIGNFVAKSPEEGGVSLQAVMAEAQGLFRPTTTEIKYKKAFPVSSVSIFPQPSVLQRLRDETEFGCLKNLEVEAPLSPVSRSTS